MSHNTMPLQRLDGKLVSHGKLTKAIRDHRRPDRGLPKNMRAKHLRGGYGITTLEKMQELTEGRYTPSYLKRPNNNPKDAPIPWKKAGPPKVKDDAEKAKALREVHREANKGRRPHERLCENPRKLRRYVRANSL